MSYRKVVIMELSDIIRRNIYLIRQETSLSSFKRFLRTHNLRKEIGITCRIEQKPGHEIQIDYCEVGCLNLIKVITLGRDLVRNIFNNMIVKYTII